MSSVLNGDVNTDFGDAARFTLLLIYIQILVENGRHKGLVVFHSIYGEWAFRM